MTTDNEAIKSAERNAAVRRREEETARQNEIARQERLKREEDERRARSETRQQTNNERLAEANREKKAKEAQELRVTASENTERAKGILEAAERRNEDHIKKEREDVAAQIDKLPGGIAAALAGYGYVHKSDGDRVQQKIKNGTPLTYNEFERLFSRSGDLVSTSIDDPHGHIKVYAKKEDSYFKRVLDDAMILSLLSMGGGQGRVATTESRRLAQARIVNPSERAAFETLNRSSINRVNTSVKPATTGGASGGFGPLETAPKIPQYVSSNIYKQWQRELATVKNVDSNAARSRVTILEYNLAQFKPLPANAPLTANDNVKVVRFAVASDIRELNAEIKQAKTEGDTSRVKELEEIRANTQVVTDLGKIELKPKAVSDSEVEGQSIRIDKTKPSTKTNTGVSSSTFNKSSTGEDVDQFKPKATPKVDTQTKTEPKVEPKVEPKIGDGTLPEIKPQTKTITQPKAEPKIEVKTDTKVEEKQETKTQDNNKTVVDTKIEPKIEPKVEPKTEIKTETKTVVDNGGGGKSDDKNKNKPNFNLNDADLKKLAKRNDGKYVTKFQYQQGNVGKEVNLLTGKTRGLKRSEYKVIPGRTAQESLEVTGFSDVKPKYFKFDIGKFIVDTSSGRLSYEVDKGQSGVLRTGNSRKKLVK